MPLKQPGAFTFTKVDLPGNVFQGNGVAIVFLNIGKNLLKPVVVRAVFLGILWLVDDVGKKQPPHHLQMNGNIQLIKFRFFLIQGNNCKKMFPECTVPGFTLINADCRQAWVLDHRVHIFAVDGTLEKSVDEPGVKGYRNVGAVLMVFHGTEMKDIGIVEYNVSFFQMIGQVIDLVAHGAGLHIGDLDFRVPMPHESTGFILGKLLVAYQEGKMLAAVLF